jgi:hypothetical protein
MDGIDGSDYPSPYPVDQRGAPLINSIDYRRFGTDGIEQPIPAQLRNSWQSQLLGICQFAEQALRSQRLFKLLLNCFLLAN